MSSQTAVILAVYLYIAISIWHLVLRKAAYPEYVPTHLKWIHALILFFVMSSAFYSFFAVFLWFVVHPSEIVACLTSQPNKIGDPFLGIAGLIRGLTGTVLLSVCTWMAKRRQSALKWYLLLWPLLFVSSCFMAFRRDEHIQTGPIIPTVATMTFLAFILVGTMTFYSQRSTMVIFEEQKIIRSTEP